MMTVWLTYKWGSVHTNLHDMADISDVWINKNSWSCVNFQKTKINTDINPDEAIAYGAAVQGAILAGDKSKLVVD